MDSHAPEHVVAGWAVNAELVGGVEDCFIEHRGLSGSENGGACGDSGGVHGAFADDIVFERDTEDAGIVGVEA